MIAGSAQITPGARLSELRPPPGKTQSQTLKVLPIEGDQSGDQFRVFALGAQGRSGALTVYVGISLDPVDDNILVVRRILFVVLPVLLVIVSGTGWYFVGRALRPVDVIRQQVADIGGSDLSRRVPEPPLDDEIGRLARGMNLMLNRLQSSNERQRRFVADASHELQSPLASSLSDLEEALAHPDATEWSEIAAGLIVDNQRMAKLVGDSSTSYHCDRYGRSSPLPSPKRTRRRGRAQVRANASLQIRRHFLAANRPLQMLPQASIVVAHQIILVHRSSPRPLPRQALIPYDLATPANSSRNNLRPRLSRDITVPIGTCKTSAASL